MALVVTQIVLRGYRSYDSFELKPDEHLTILVGPNAAGKTNIVEAIELVTAADSFRHPQWSELVKWGEGEGSVSLHAEGDGRVLEIDMNVSASGRRVYRVNGKVRRRVAEVAGIIPCVVFTPDDLRLVKDSADKRRAAIDGVGDQLSPAYMGVRLEYERIVRQRNALLKEVDADENVTAALTSRLVGEGVAFMGHRRRLFDRIAEKMSEIYSTLSKGERLTARYVPSWERSSSHGPEGDARRLMEEHLREKAAEERARGLTLVGPHRDEVEFAVGGHDARTYASQGQTRTIALAWKLAEVAVIREIAGQAPVLLLDDVMSELDQERRHALAAFVGDVAQTFVTTTNLGYFEEGLVARAKVVEVV